MGTGQDDKTYAQSMAADIYAMISTSREQGIDLSKGFHNQAFSNPTMSIRYLFFPKKELLSMGHFPADLTKQFKSSNILSIIESKGKAVSVNLLCALGKGFADIQSAEEIETNLRSKEVEGFASALKKILAQDFKDATEKATKTDA
ncbi:MAG: hypothetical protein WC124_01430 [Desulfoplanes sp.]